MTSVSDVRASSAVDDDIARLAPWFHNLHLPDGRQTAPAHWLGDFPMVKWRQIAPHIPERLDGWRVLDIGCNAGFYTFQLAARGATVTAVDIDEHYLRQARWAAREFGVSDSVEFRQMSVYDLARHSESYDLIWFLGVLYHLRHPLLALDILRERTQRMMVLQTMTMPGMRVVSPDGRMGLDDRDIMRADGWPVMAFIEGELEDDPTNWWAPNHACVEAMVRSSGFRVASRPAHEVYICEPVPDGDSHAARLRKLELDTLFGR